MQCGGLTRALIRDYDWAATALVPINTWPQSLETAVGMVLHSTVPIVLLWGADGVVICNDTYSRFAGARHPQTLGAKVREAWVEVADFNDNVVKVGLSGGTLAYKDQELTLYGYGVAAQVWMSLNYSPVLDAYRRDRDRARNHGSSAGGSAQRGRARSIAQDVRTPPGFMAVLKGPNHVFTLANAAYMHLIGPRDVIGTWETVISTTACNC